MGKLEGRDDPSKREQHKHKVEQRGGDPIKKPPKKREKTQLEFIVEAAEQQTRDRAMRLEERNKQKPGNDPRTIRFEERNVQKRKIEAEQVKILRQKRKAEAEPVPEQPPRKKSKVAKREEVETSAMPASEALESDDEAAPSSKRRKGTKGKEVASAYSGTSESDISDRDAESSREGLEGTAESPREGLKETKEIVIKTFQPEEPFRLRNCRVDSVRNIKSVARALHRALESDALPEHVYLQLFLLLRERPAIRKLEKGFKEIDGKGKEIDGRDLETALTEHFGEDSSQLQLALQLIRKGEVGTDRAIDEDLRLEGDKARSEKLRKALLSGNAEEVYAILAPFQRCTERLCKFNEVYKRNNSDIGMQADIKQYLTGDSQKFARYLIGEGGLSWGDDSDSQEDVDSDQSRDPMEHHGPPDHLREIPYLETVVIPESVAEHLAMAAVQLTYQPDSEKPDRVPVPYDEPHEGCQCRAHIIAQAFKELGYASEIIYAHSRRVDDRGIEVDDLFLQTDLAHDDPRTLSDTPPVIGRYWCYHTGCCILVRTRSGDIERRIVDPAMDRDEPARLWTVDEWMKRMGKNPDSYDESMTFKEWEKVLEERHKKRTETNPDDPANLPVGTYVFTMSRNYIGIAHLSMVKGASRFKDMPDQYSNTGFNIKGRKELNEHIKQVSNCRTAQILRRVMREQSSTNNEGIQEVIAAVKKIRRATMEEFHLSTSGKAFSVSFSDTYNRFITYLEKCGISPEVVASFKECVSDHEEQDQPFGPSSGQIGTSSTS